jgi:hypothetical protein
MSSSIYHISICRKQPDGNYKKFGSIEYMCKGKTVDILMLFINDVAERGKGYGYGLILLSLCNIIKTYPGAYNITKIKLDDDSDGALTTNSIYYKLGFRIFHGDEVMEIKFLKPPLSKRMKSKLFIYEDEGHTEPYPVYHKTILDLYENTISNRKYNQIISGIIGEVEHESLKFTINNNITDEPKDLDISECLNIKPEIESNTRSLRKRTRS